MWMVDPKILCRKHLLGEHVELHMLDGHLRRGRRIDGFVRNNCTEPASITSRHLALATEMERRGYRHVSPLNSLAWPDYATIKVDAEASLAELLRRCPECREQFVKVSTDQPLRRSTRDGSEFMTENFLAQAHHAELSRLAKWQRLLDAGWVEISPEALAAPDGAQEVWFD
jgi:hypothetical protein